MMNSIPLTLYIHIPWCVRKCPYCDFNSHNSPSQVPEQAYVDALLQDLNADLARFPKREIQSIFIGGGTPSLFSANALGKLLEGVAKQVTLSPHVEITLEANPGTVEQKRFEGFRLAGINRLSIGVQSFQSDKLKALGRIHNDQEAIKAIEAAKKAGFTNFNIDLMYGLPEQTLEDALFDLRTAIELEPTHLSWYQLTIEPNTLFYQQPPSLPNDDFLFAMQEAGQALIVDSGFLQYEISAYSKPHYQCKHNLNYWEFGDYLGIGAGAHGKITDEATGKIYRYWKLKHPKAYLNTKNFTAETKQIADDEKLFEFMLNALRLTRPIPLTLVEQRAGLSANSIKNIITHIDKSDLMEINSDYIIATALGKRFLNNLLECFLSDQ